MAEKKKVLYIVEAMGGGVFTYIVDLANELVNAPLREESRRLEIASDNVYSIFRKTNEMKSDLAWKRKWEAKVREKSRQEQARQEQRERQPKRKKRSYDMVKNEQPDCSKVSNHRQPLPQQETTDRYHEPGPDGVEEPTGYRTRPHL